MTEDSLQNGCCSSAGESKCGREDGAKFFDNLLANSTGFYPREGKAVGQAIEGLSPVPAKDGTGYNLSDEIDEDGSLFVISSTGTTVFGEIKEETGLTPAPIKLSRGNSKYGLVHLEKRHGEQIRKAGFNSVEEFVEYVCKNYNRIRQGENSAGEENGTYLLQIEDNHNNTLYVELSADGSYWGVNSGGVFIKTTVTIRKKYGLPPKCRMSSRLLTALCEMRINPTILQILTVMCPILLSTKVQQF